MARRDVQSERELREAFAKMIERLRVRAGESVLIVDDTETEQEISRGLFEALEVLGAEPAICTIVPRTDHGAELPASVVAALERVDAAFVVTRRSATHSEGLHSAARRGVRVASAPVTVEMLRGGVLSIDYDALCALTVRLCELLARARVAEVRTPVGTQLRFELGGWDRLPMADCGRFEDTGNVGNLPAGEALKAPLEGTANGVLVVDSFVSTDGLLSSPITLVFRDGAVVDVLEGGTVPRLVAAFERHGGSSRNLAEFALGTNPRARRTGQLLEDEKQLGTAHVGLGNSTKIGGIVASTIHIDCIFSGPTLFLDGRPVMEDGVLSEAALVKESFRAFPPRPRRLKRTAADVEVQAGRLHRVWRDGRGRRNRSQVGDEETAIRAAALLERTTVGVQLTGEEAQVCAVMALYGVTADAD